MARVLKWAFLLIIASAFCRFLLRNKNISVLASKPISGNRDFSTADQTHIDISSKGANPSLSLLDEHRGYSKMNRRLLAEESLLHQSSSPTIGRDGRVYACIGSNAYAFNLDGTLAWTAGLNDTCQILVSPVINSDGRVYVAANHKIYLITYSQELNFISVWDLFNGTSLDGSMLGSKPITGLALMGNGTSILINAGVAGLYAVAEDGSPLWSTSGDFNSIDATFSPGTFCSKQDKLCYFHFSPAIDYCAGSIYGL